ncbi:hypothetical protein GCM10009780_75670 [Actinomadura alba]
MRELRHVPPQSDVAISVDRRVDQPGEAAAWQVPPLAVEPGRPDAHRPAQPPSVRSARPELRDDLAVLGKPYPRDRPDSGCLDDLAVDDADLRLVAHLPSVYQNRHRSGK